MPGRSASPIPHIPRRRVPTMLQMEATECGAAALGMVLGYHGAWKTLEELRAECGVSRDGSKALNLLRVARRLGFDARGWRIELPELARHAMPVIAFWEFNHFVVVEGVSGGRVHLNDPATGPRKVTIAEFDTSFTGVLLTFVPTPAFRRSGSPPRSWRSLLARLTNSRGAIGFLALSGLLALLPALAFAAASKLFIDEILLNHVENWLRPLLLGLFVVMVLDGLLTWLQSRILALLQWKLSLSIGLQLFWHLLRLPVMFFTQRHTGDVAARVGAAEHLCQLLAAQMPAVLVNAVALVVYGTLMLLYDPALAGIGIGIALTGAVVTRLSARLRQDGMRRLRRESARMASVSISGLQSIETLKASGLEDEFYGRWAGAQARLLKAHQEIDLPLAMIGLLPRLIAGLAMVAVLGFGGLRIMDGHMTIGDFVAFQTFLAGFLGPAGQLLAAAATVQEMSADLERMDDVLRYPADPRLSSLVGGGAGEALRPDLPTSGGGVRLQGGVTLRGVRFGYNPLDPPLLDGLDLHLAPGSRVALVGPSGCGKSTIGRLVAGLYQPWAGDICFDGVPAQAVSRASIAASLATVDQNIVLFEGTVRDNLTLWDTTISDAEMVAAARDACIHDVIVARPGGYNAPVSEGGANFSGGQAQRLEIARALVRRPSVLVLDEATSALDPLVEARILENLRRRGCTTFFVAHRLSTIRDCDEIIVLERGRIVQRGSHQSLNTTSGLYAELIRAA